MTLRRDAFPASPVNARLSWALRLALLLQCSPVSSKVKELEEEVEKYKTTYWGKFWHILMGIGACIFISIGASFAITMPLILFVEMIAGMAELLASLSFSTGFLIVAAVWLSIAIISLPVTSCCLLEKYSEEKLLTYEKLASEKMIPVSRYSHEKFWPSCPQN
jgi:hypothetical protein